MSYRAKLKIHLCSAGVLMFGGFILLYVIGIPALVVVLVGYLIGIAGFFMYAGLGDKDGS